MSRRLVINPDPLVVVSGDVRAAWTPDPDGGYRSRCFYEDGRGQCTSRETMVHRGVEGFGRFCVKHYPVGGSS